MKTETETPYALCVRRWLDKPNGNWYYTFRVIGQGQDITASFEYGHGDNTIALHACDVLGMDWVAMDWEQRRAVFVIDEVIVSRRKELHNEGKTEQ